MLIMLTLVTIGIWEIYVSNIQYKINLDDFDKELWYVFTSNTCDLENVFISLYIIM